MFIIKSILAFLLFSFISTSSFAKQISYDCKPKSAAAIRSDGIQVFKITGKEKSVEVIIKDGENLEPGFFLVNKSKYEILDLGTGKTYAFDRNEPRTHIQDIFFMNDKTLSFVLSANGSITRYLCDENK